MTAKEYLNRGWLIERRIRAAEERLGRLNARAEALKSYAPRKKRGSRRAQEWTEAVDAMCDAERAMFREIAALYRVRAEVRAAIDAVEDVRLRALLEYRYLGYMTWPRIAEAMGYELRTVYRLHGKALMAVKKGTEMPGTDGPGR